MVERVEQVLESPGGQTGHRMSCDVLLVNRVEQVLNRS
jgi:hypothetical protein